MFKMTAEPKFTQKVKVFVPIDNGHSEEHFTATFRVLDVDDLTDLGLIDRQGEILAKALVGVSDVADDDGNAVPFSDELRDRLISTPYVRFGLIDAFTTGLLKARRGN